MATSIAVNNISPSSGFISGQSTSVTLSFTDNNPLYLAEQNEFSYSTDFDLFSATIGGTNLGNLTTYSNTFSSDVSPLSIVATRVLNIPSGLTSGTYYVGATFGGSRFAITISAPVNNITISFNINGGTGTTPASITRQSGSVFSLPTSSGLSRNGFTVFQWNTNSSGTGINYSMGTNQVFTSNVTLFARWVPTVYNILINENGGSLVSDPTYTIQTFQQGIAFNRPNPPAGRLFFQYTVTTFPTPQNAITSPFTSNQVIIPANTFGNIGIRVDYSIISYTITYVLNDGINNAANPNTYDITTEGFILSPATKSGSTFNGWYTNETFTNQIFAIGGGQIGNLTLHARFDVVKYTVNFINNLVNIKSTQEIFGTTFSSLQPLPNPTKTSVKNVFKFIGWNENSSATTGNLTIPGTVSRNISFHAIYESFASGLKINNKNINLKIGDDQVNKVYLGTQLIWEKL